MHQGPLRNHHAFVLSNRKETDSLFVMTLHARELAETVLPGQFVHMEIPTQQSHILRRPFSIYGRDVEGGNVDILYQVVGAGTADMTKWQPGYLTTMIGPIGRPWTVPEGASRALLVGGGVGAAPLFMLYEQLIEANVTTDVILGASSGDALVCRSRYESVCGQSPSCSTDDGSFGREGFCTTLLAENIAGMEAEGPYDYSAVCGPEVLMRIASGMLIEAGVPCQVSMEKRMACGIGACLSCVVETTEGKKRSCVDGPIFDGEELIW